MIKKIKKIAVFAQRAKGLQDLKAQKSMEKLSSGEKINRAGDKLQ